MTGAIIPDDWDGVTFECQKVEWPASPQWQAILLGQVSEPAKSFYWDPDTGDVVDAIVAVDDAFALTVPAIYEEPCNVHPGIPVPAFHASKDETQVVPAVTWTTILWDELTYDLNTPNFSLALNSHVPVNEDLIGLWHYDVYIRVAAPSQFIRIRAIQQPGNVVKAFAGVTSDARLGMSFDIPHEEASEQVRIEINPTLEVAVSFVNPDTRFQGHFVGPVES